MEWSQNKHSEKNRRKKNIMYSREFEEVGCDAVFAVASNFGGGGGGGGGDDGGRIRRDSSVIGTMSSSLLLQSRD
jgi:hypothetical protein